MKHLRIKTVKKIPLATIIIHGVKKSARWSSKPVKPVSTVTLQVKRQ
jgi:hypothetical protein